MALVMALVMFSKPTLDLADHMDLRVVLTLNQQSHEIVGEYSCHLYQPPTF